MTIRGRGRGTTLSFFRLSSLACLLLALPIIFLFFPSEYSNYLLLGYLSLLACLGVAFVLLLSSGISFMRVAPMKV